MAAWRRFPKNFDFATRGFRAWPRLSLAFETYAALIRCEVMPIGECYS